jgi:tetratricopeptide (TPR) repeat protein
MTSLSKALQRMFLLRGDHRDLEQAVELSRRAYEISVPASGSHSLCIVTLGNALRVRSQENKSKEDLEEALSFCREAVQGCQPDSPILPECLNSLGAVLAVRAQRSNSLDDIEERIEVHRRAMELSTPGDYEYSRASASCATALWSLFGKRGGLDRLDEAILLFQQAIHHHPTHPDQDAYTGALGSTLTSRYGAVGSVADLEESIVWKEKSLGLRPPGHITRPSALTALANSLRDRFQELGSKSDLERSIALLQEALTIQSPDHPLRSTSINSLATSYSIRFEDEGDTSDLEQAIRLFHEGLELRPPPHPQRFASLSNLSAPLRHRYTELGHPEDRETMIRLQRECLSLTPAGHPFRAQALGNLAGSLNYRFEDTGSFHDLEEALVLLHEAIALCEQGQLTWYLVVHARAETLRTRYNHFQNIKDLDEAIEIITETFTRGPIPSQQRPRHLVLLGSLYRDRFIAQKITSDAAQALQHLSEALEILGVRSMERSQCLVELAKLYLEADAPCHDPRTALDYIILSVGNTSCSAQLRLNYAAEALRPGEYSIPEDTRDQLLQAQLAVVNLLPHAAYFGLDVRSRLAAVRKGEAVAVEAASNALALSRPALAIEILEQGRCVFWTQALRLRSPFDALEDRARETLVRLARELEGRSHGSSAKTSQMEADEEVAYLRELDRKFNILVDEVRQKPGMKDFLRPDGLSTLSKAAEDGPVVILISSTSSCDAIIVRDSYDPAHVSLDGVTDAWLRESALAWRNAMNSSRHALRNERRLGISKKSTRAGATIEQNRILSKLWEAVTLPVFQKLGLKVGSQTTLYRGD